MALKEALELQDDSRAARVWELIGPGLLPIAEAQIARRAAQQESAAPQAVEDDTKEPTDKP